MRTAHATGDVGVMSNEVDFTFVKIEFSMFDSGPQITPSNPFCDFCHFYPDTTDAERGNEGVLPQENNINKYATY